MDGEDAGVSEFQNRLEALKSTWKSLFVRFTIFLAKYQFFTGCIMCVVPAFQPCFFSASATRITSSFVTVRNWDPCSLSGLSYLPQSLYWCLCSFKFFTLIVYTLWWLQRGTSQGVIRKGWSIDQSSRWGHEESRAGYTARDRYSQHWSRWIVT